MLIWSLAGQGTIGLEILNQQPDVDIVVVPVGGGGLISGIARACKEINPHIKVIGVEPSKIPSMAKAVAGDRSVQPAVMVSDLDARTFPLNNCIYRDLF